MTDKEKIQKLEPFDCPSYEAIDLDRLIIYTTVNLQEIGVELSLENIIVGAFKLFPKKFSLSGYIEFPDATRVEKCLWRCKGKKRQWIGGKTPHGYQVTEKAKIIATQTEAQLSNTALQKNQKTASRTRRKESILKETTDSPAYNKYISNQGDSISESDLCYLLQGTLDSSRQVLKENLTSLKKFAKELEREKVVKFLCWLEIHFKSFLNINNK